ncbi:PAAR domain-containing protein, partial [Pseudomonas syringae pv. tagetis]
GVLVVCVQGIVSLLCPLYSMSCVELLRLFHQLRSSLGHLGFVVMQDQRCPAVGALDLQGDTRSDTSPAVPARQLATTAPWKV